MFAIMIVAMLPTAAPESTPAVIVERDIVYATVNGEKLKLDLARPNTPGPHPLAVGFHGGAWKYGSKREISMPNAAIFDFGGTGKISLMEFIARKGYVCVSVDYRLAPKHKWPAPAIDAKTAVRFLRAQAGKYGIDPDRVGVFGFSAGGHLAALLGTADKDAGLDGDLYTEQSSRVQCVVDYFGPSDLSLYASSEGIERAYMKPFLGATFAEKPEVFKQASPITYVDKTDPPFMIFHGTLDVIVPIIHGEKLHEKLKAAGVDSTFINVYGKGHGWEGETATRTREQAIEFMDKHLKSKK
jgi:acetyl esterase/lipase